MMRNFLWYGIMGLYFLPLTGIAQTKEVQKEKVIMMTKNTKDSLILYVINNKYYLGNTVDILIPRLDASKIKKIEQVRNEEAKSKYSKSAGKFSKNISGIFVIETTENFEHKTGIKK